MSTLRLTTISNQTGSSSVPSETVINGSAKAWVNFNGTGTVAIRASFNVSSITDGGTGQYTVNFTNAMVDENYVVESSSTASGGTYSLNVLDWNSSGYSARTASAVKIALLAYNASNYYDSVSVNVAVFR